MSAEPDAVLPLDLGRIVESLGRHGVSYVIVGGVAGRLHGASRVTFDLDVLAQRDVENLDRVAAVLRELGAFLRVGGLDDETARALPFVLDGRSLSAMDISTWRTEAGDLDVLADLKDATGQPVPFEEVAGRATTSSLEGVGVRLVSLPDLITAKRFAGRAKDQDALPELEALRDAEPGS
ncbi:MAG: hypothetical protein ABIP03_14970 [Aquihabitans sp.]